MFNQLNDRLGATVKKLRGQARLTHDNMQEVLREVRRALLEAGVGLPVIKKFLEDIENRFIGEEVGKSLSPGQQLIAIIQQELTNLLGSAHQPLNLTVQPPAVILLAGLQGVGKTTTVGKLAKKLILSKKRVLVASADVYRPAAIEQLKVLAGQANADFFSHQSTKPLEIVNAAKAHAKQHLYDVLIVDTAGRLAIDETMMSEISQIQQALNPIETLFVADSQQGQDAVTVAHAFSDAINISGLVFTKVDGDARGGAILSVTAITNKPIKLISVGEKLDDLQDFHPDRIASRILGMGDVLGLIEELQEKTDAEQAKKLSKKIVKTNSVDFHDMLEQFSQMDKMGGFQSLLDKLPGMGNLGGALKSAPIDDKALKHQKAIIQSMTYQERSNPLIIKGSRKRRIANGSGRSIQEVNRLLKQQKEMKGMMRKMKNKNFARQMQSMMGGGMGGNMGGNAGRGGFPF